MPTDVVDFVNSESGQQFSDLTPDSHYEYSSDTSGSDAFAPLAAAAFTVFLYTSSVTPG